MNTQVKGCFVADMVQSLKYSAIRAAGVQALERLQLHLAARQQEQLEQAQAQAQTHAPLRARMSSRELFSLPHSSVQTLPMPSADRRGRGGQSLSRTAPGSGDNNKNKNNDKNKNKQQQPKEALSFANIPDFEESNQKRSRK